MSLTASEIRTGEVPMSRFLCDCGCLVEGQENSQDQAMICPACGKRQRKPSYRRDRLRNQLRTYGSVAVVVLIALVILLTLLPFIGEIRKAAHRIQAANNMRQF